MKRITLITLLLLAFGFSLSLGQHRKRSKSVPLLGRPTRDHKGPFATQCDVPYKNVADFTEERSVEWRLVARDDEQVLYFYNTNTICDQKTRVLKVWLKQIHLNEARNLSYRMLRYEIKCKSEEYRIMDFASYDKQGKLVESDSPSDTEIKWQPATPESVAAIILQTICRK